MKLNILMVEKKKKLINLNWKPTQMVVEPYINFALSRKVATKAL